MIQIVNKDPVSQKRMTCLISKDKSKNVMKHVKVLQLKWLVSLFFSLFLTI